MRRCDAFGAVLLAVAVSGCAVGPDYVAPKAPAKSDYIAHPVLPLTGDSALPGAQTLTIGGDVPGRWWSAFGSPAVSAAVERALAHNPDIAAAEAALDVAHETALATAGAYYPSLGVNLAASRQLTSSALSPTPNSGALNFSLYTPQLSISYMPDVFGLTRRSVEAAQAQADQAAYALQAARVTLASNVVLAMIQSAALHDEIVATDALIDDNRRLLDMLKRQEQAGYASRIDVATQEAQLAQAIASLPPLQKQAALQHDLIAQLTGDQGEAARILSLNGLSLPHALPVSLPAQLVWQRPDILQAEANLRAANAGIGVAEASRLPNLTLTADAGTSALAIGQIAASPAGFWSLGADLAAPIFAGGALEHRTRAARAAYTQAAAQYRSTVLGALRDVADTLHTIKADGDGLTAAAAAQRAAQTNLELIRKQAAAGYAPGLTLITAEVTRRQAELARIQAEANRYSDTVALFQALGGGWWSAPSAG